MTIRGNICSQLTAISVVMTGADRELARRDSGPFGPVRQTGESTVNAAQTLTDTLMRVDAEIRVPVATAQLVRFHVSGPADDILRDEQTYWLDLCLTPRPRNARARYLDHWGPHRFERIGNLFVVPPGQRMQARSDGGPPQASILCHLCPEPLRQWLDRDLEWTDRRLTASLDIPDANIRGLLLRLAEELRHPGFASEMLVELIVAQLAIELARYCTTVEDVPASGGLAPWRLRRIEERLKEVREAPTLSELAGLCNLSVRQLTRAFRASRGRSIGEYVEQCRLDHAKRLLATDASVKAIAYSLGFASPSSFSFAFRRSTGETPREFRQRVACELTLHGRSTPLWPALEGDSRCPGAMRGSKIVCERSRVTQTRGNTGMPQKLVADELIEAAQKATGLQRFDSQSFREGLGILLADANELDYPEAGAQRFRGSIVAALANRLKTTDYLQQRPELLQRPIKRPVFVFGVPRTGTTLLSNLLAADPARRSPLTWEIDDPVPPPTKDSLYTDPRALARLEMERRMLAARPDAGKYYRSSAIYPNECMFFINSDFKALMWEGRGKLPNYRDWLFNSADLTSTYRYHKRFLQVLQADAPGVWNLKQPSHALWLETLLAIYPDARLVWTHRDPLAATGSLCSLMKMASSAVGLAPDLEWIAQNYSWQAVEHANRIMDSRAKLGRERIVDVHYADLMRDPLGTTRKLYQSLGDEFTPEAESAMRAWLAENPQDKFGKHEYELGQFGLTPEQVRNRFERYLSEYEVEPEG